MRLRSLFALVAFAPFLSAAAQPVRLQPSSPWDVDYAENSCRLIRTFGQGADQTTLVLESVGPGSLTMTAAGRPLKASVGAKMATRLLPTGISQFEGTAQQAVDYKPAVLWPFVPFVTFDPQKPPKTLDQVKRSVTISKSTRPKAIDLAQRDAMLSARKAILARTTELEVTAPGRAPVIFELGVLDAPIDAFDQCDRDLIRSVGLDPDLQAQIVRPVWTPDISKWIGPQMYPQEALNLGQDSRVSARLLVDSTGKVTKCTSLTPYNTPAFNRATCEALAKAQFMPAELQNGEKVPSYFLLDITFRIGP